MRPYFLRVVAGCSYSVPKWQLHVVTLIYLIKLPKFVQRKYASIVNNIDVGMQITQQKNAKIMKKIFKKKFISDLPNLIFSGYENFF
jgi:hypothetical protein